VRSAGIFLSKAITHGKIIGTSLLFFKVTQISQITQIFLHCQQGPAPADLKSAVKEKVRPMKTGDL
jgi:hypothetical protein